MIMQTIRVQPGTPLRGTVQVPGDKSIAHRALILAAMAHGASHIENVPGNDDVQATMRCLRELGVSIEFAEPLTTVQSEGRRHWRQPSGELDCGESGTTMRLFAFDFRRPFSSRWAI